MGGHFFVVWDLYGPILRRFEVLTPLQNPPPRLNFLEYVLLRVQDQNGAFLLDFLAICGFSLVGDHFLSFGAFTGPF